MPNRDCTALPTWRPTASLPTRVRIFEGSPGEASPVFAAIMTDLGDGPSVTNNVEQLAGQLVMRFVLPSVRTAFIEHYLEGRYGGREDPEPTRGANPE